MSCQRTTFEFIQQPLVALVSLIAAGAVIAGSYSLISPASALQVFGVSSAADKHAKPSVRLANADKDYEPIARSLSIRNLALGISIFAMTVHWQRAVCEDALAGEAVRVSLGYLITSGSIVPLVDAYGAWTDGSPDLRMPAAVLHLLRFVAWIGGGLWCLHV